MLIITLDQTQVSSGRVIGTSQRPLLDNTQHSQDNTFMNPPAFFIFSCTLYFICTCVFYRNLSLLTTHNTNIIPPAEFEPATSASERPQTLALNRSATGIGTFNAYCCILHYNKITLLHTADWNWLWSDVIMTQTFVVLHVSVQSAIFLVTIYVYLRGLENPIFVN